MLLAIFYAQVVAAFNHSFCSMPRWWTWLLCAMVGSVHSDVESASDPVPDCWIWCVVGWFCAFVAAEAFIQLITSTRNATMVQAKTLKCQVKVSNFCLKHPVILPLYNAEPLDLLAKHVPAWSMFEDITTSQAKTSNSITASSPTFESTQSCNTVFNIIAWHWIKRRSDFESKPLR